MDNDNNLRIPASSSDRASQISFLEKSPAKISFLSFSLIDQILLSQPSTVYPYDDSLSTVCQKVISEYLTTENVFAAFAIAFSYGFRFLFAECAHRIREDSDLRMHFVANKLTVLECFAPHEHQLSAIVEWLISRNDPMEGVEYFSDKPKGTLEYTMRS